MDYSKIISNRIIQLCHERNITINKLATMSGLKQSTVDNIIHGKSKNPQIYTLHKISISFNMTLSEFLDFSELNALQLDEDDD